MVRKNKISPIRLSKIITLSECRSTQDYLIELYDRLSPQNRQDIKNILCFNKSLTNY